MKPPSHDILRIIDASLNRIGEGLRVLEEYARFSLDDTVLTQQLKNLRLNGDIQGRGWLVGNHQGRLAR